MRVPRPQPWGLGLLLLLLPGTPRAESPAKSSMPVVGIIIGFLLLLIVAGGGALLWRRMRSGLPAPWISFHGDDVGSLLPTPGLSKDVETDRNAFPEIAC
uniref:Fc gamma receptor and transporter n=1 Tax=Catagonus wagneri TaxID=51154 RepID=A0A8C3YE82_9CETA